MRTGRQYFTVKEFAKAFMVPEGEVVWAASFNKIKAEEIDGKLMIPRSEILRLLRELNPKLTDKDLDIWEEMCYGN